MNKGKMIRLTDGTVIEAKMNFGTIYYLDQIGGSKLGRRIDKLEKIGKATDSDKMNFAAKLIYAMVRSNGRKVTFVEALQLYSFPASCFYTCSAAFTTVACVTGSTYSSSLVTSKITATLSSTARPFA